MMTSAIRTASLCRTFKLPTTSRRSGADAAPSAFHALNNVNLEVQQGELFGLLGSNGAGKSTLIKILTTLLAPTSGTAEVDGLNVITQADRIRQRINMVSGGETSGYGILTVRENLWLFSQLYGVTSKETRRRIDHLLAVVGLEDKADTRITHLSTGLRQKMNFCRGFVTDPQVLFLDEPTLGLDVTAARAARQFLRDWMSEQPTRTLLLTTHYLAEADELCDRVAVIHQGRLLACDTPATLKQRFQRSPTFELSVTPGASGWHDLNNLPGVQSCRIDAKPSSVELKVSLHEEAVVGALVQEILRGGGRILSLRKVEWTLEDVFVELVGHGIDAAEEQP